MNDWYGVLVHVLAAIGLISIVGTIVVRLTPGPSHRELAMEASDLLAGTSRDLALARLKIADLKAANERLTEAYRHQADRVELLQDAGVLPTSDPITTAGLDDPPATRAHVGFGFGVAS